MMEHPTIPGKVCGQCGVPATNAAVDVFEDQDDGAVWKHLVKSGEPKYGCDQHPTESFNLGWIPLGPRLA